MMKYIALYLFFIFCVIHLSSAGSCSKNCDGRRRRRSNVPHQVLANVQMAMEQAKQNDPSMAVIDKCIAAETAVRDTLAPSNPPQVRKATKDLLIDFDQMYNIDGNRDPSAYYSLLQQTYPNLGPLQALSEGEFGMCFGEFVELHDNSYAMGRIQNEYPTRQNNDRFRTRRPGGQGWAPEEPSMNDNEVARRPQMNDNVASRFSVDDNVGRTPSMDDDNEVARRPSMDDNVGRRPRPGAATQYGDAREMDEVDFDYYNQYY